MRAISTVRTRCAPPRVPCRANLRAGCASRSSPARRASSPTADASRAAASRASACCSGSGMNAAHGYAASRSRHRHFCCRCCSAAPSRRSNSRRRGARAADGPRALGRRLARRGQPRLGVLLGQRHERSPRLRRLALAPSALLLPLLHHLAEATRGDEERVLQPPRAVQSSATGNVKTAPTTMPSTSLRDDIDFEREDPYGAPNAPPRGISRSKPSLSCSVWWPKTRAWRASKTQSGFSCRNRGVYYATTVTGQENWRAPRGPSCVLTSSLGEAMI